MAKKYKGNIMVDYYVKYQLDKTASAKDCLKALRRIQGDIRTALADGSLNSKEILNKLQEQNAEIVEAIKCFKSKEKKEEYDERLRLAYEANAVDLEAPALSQELFDEIMALFSKCRYQQVIQKCMEAIGNNIYDVRLYHYMAMSYKALGRSKEALNAVNDGLKVDAKNIELMKIGSRVYTDDYENYDEAQKMINRMYELDGAEGTATAEQINLYMNFDKKEVAYQTLDEYMQKNPNDMQFKQQCAYDFIGTANKCFVEVKDGEGNSGAVIIEKAEYEKCLEYCQKAASLYNDENTQAALEEAKHFGEIEFNDDNAHAIKWCMLSGLLYLLCAMLGGTAAPMIIAVPCFIAGVGLFVVSRRPYWQIYKFYFTGKREPVEMVFLIVGKVVGFFMEWMLKLAWWLVKFIFGLVFRLT